MPEGDTIHRTAGRLSQALHGAVVIRFAAPVVEMLRSSGARNHHLEIGAALLDQKITAGIGNIYKSETLFACGVNPFAAVGSLDDHTKRRILTTASRLLRQGRPDMPAVYGRERRPCRRCGAPVARHMQSGRATYWCPRCQS